MSGAAAMTEIPPDDNIQTEEAKPVETSDEILIAPTLAPTATPGVIYGTVQQVVEATNLEETHISGIIRCRLDQPGDLALASVPDPDFDRQVDFLYTYEDCQANRYAL